MKIIFAYILLILYAATCTGMTVYMHRCQEGALIAFDTKKDLIHDSCPHCAESESAEESHQDAPTACHEKENCCSEIVLDLRKSETKMENASNMLPLFSTSPAILTLFWIVPIPDSKTIISNAADFRSPLASVAASPPYLVHCNFRI
ncbi:hypothetical protein [Sphingobacterium deserti]|uniref:Uncharacterized protein n=1 Tax=Sphingobacterium deserti TaxID=1229276 RepID=A0A0B8T220_9SPHI|nr:hypothetical protein [Sphingobacterium deserti]KGE15207.1 hypothetical protein DI53_0888 [Sphingobacterium deserti]